MGFSKVPSHSSDSSLDRIRHVRRLRRLAWVMDAAVRLPGTRFRFGAGGVLGLPPAIGDATVASISLYIVWQAQRLGVPRPILAKMLRNVAIEWGGGLIPLGGVLFDMAFKANLRNVALLEEWLKTNP